LYKKVKINLAELLFDHLCFTISKSRTKSPSVIHHPRLISEIIRQTRLTDILSSKEKLRVFQTAKYDANVLVNMKLVKKELKQKLLREPWQLRRRRGQRKEMKDHHPLEMMTMFLYLLGSLSRGRRR
jgi:hypothetical protein